MGEPLCVPYFPGSYRWKGSHLPAFKMVEGAFLRVSAYFHMHELFRQLCGALSYA
jgi:hypothetical protein